MLYRILLDPTPTDGGGGTAPAASPPASPSPAAPSAPVAEQPSSIPVPYAELQRLYAERAEVSQRLAEYERQKAEAEQARIREAAEKGQHQRAYEELQAKTQREMEQLRAERAADLARYQQTLKSQQISAALARRGDLADGASIHLERLLATDPNLAVETDATGNYVVRTRNFEPVDAYLKSVLEKPENRLFLKPTTTGGTGSTTTVGGQSQPPPTDPLAATFAAIKAARETAKGGAVGLSHRN